MCQEWEDLLAQEEVQLKDAQKEKVLREKREQEETERKERERKERATEQGKTQTTQQHKASSTEAQGVDSAFHRCSGDSVKMYAIGFYSERYAVECLCISL